MDSRLVAATHSPAKELIPWLIAKVLLRGLNAESQRISVQLSGLWLLAQSLNPRRVWQLTEDGAKCQQLNI